LQNHDLEPQSYRLKYGIPPKQSLAAREATARRRQWAKSIRPWDSARVANLGAKRSNGMVRKQASG
jgi:predicted transcriptional regulator